VLPEQTADDTDTAGGDWREGDSGDSSEADQTDAWLERERPPHWE